LKAEVFLISDAGMGKRTPMKEFPTQGRYGVGVTAASLSGKQRLAGMCVGDPADRLFVVTSKGGAKQIKLEAAGRRGRAARGSGIVSLKAGEVVTRVVAALEQISLPEPEPVKAAPTVKAKGTRAKNGTRPHAKKTTAKSPKRKK